MSNLLDHFGGSKYAYKPSGIVTYSSGVYGGARFAVQLRALTGELGCISVSKMISIPHAQNVEDGKLSEASDRWLLNMQKFIDQLEWVATAFRNHKDYVGVPK